MAAGNHERHGNEKQKGYVKYGSFYRKKDINFTKQKEFREYKIRQSEGQDRKKSGGYAEGSRRRCAVS